MQYIKCNLISTKTNNIDSFCVVPVQNSQVVFRKHIFKWKTMLSKIKSLLPTLSKHYFIDSDKIFSLDDLQVVFITDFRSLNNSVFVYFFHKNSSRPIYYILSSNDFSYKRKLKDLFYSDTMLCYESNLSSLDKKLINYIDIWNRDNIQHMRPSK